MRPLTTRTPALMLLGTLFLLAGPAHSQRADYGRAGPYLGLNVIGGSYTRFDQELEDQLRSVGYIVNSDTDTAVGFNMYGGYRFDPHFAVEGEFEMLTKADIDIGGLGKIAELETWTLTTNAKAFALTGRVQPFLLVGVGVMQAKIDDTVGANLSQTEDDFAARFGVGLDIYISEHVLASAGVDYVLPTGNVEYVDYVSFGAGFGYRFQGEAETHSPRMAETACNAVAGGVGEACTGIGPSTTHVLQVFNTESASGTLFRVWQRLIADASWDFAEQYDCKITGVTTTGTLLFSITEVDLDSNPFNPDCGDFGSSEVVRWADRAVAAPAFALDQGPHELECVITTSDANEVGGFDGFLFTSDLSYVPDEQNTACDDDALFEAGTCFGNWGPNVFYGGKSVPGLGIWGVLVMVGLSVGVSCLLEQRRVRIR